MSIIIYLITVFFSILSLYYNIAFKFFGLLKADETYSLIASYGFSILLILIGDRLAVVVDNSKSNKKINNNLNSKFSQFPQFNIISEFKSSDEAMKYLCDRIPHAKSILNTKISELSIQPRYDIGEKYKSILKKSLKEGLVYKDVISSGFKEYADEMLQLTKSNSCKGRYDYHIEDTSISTFLNFIIIDCGKGEKELIVGWATSAVMGTEQESYKIRDVRIINYFEKIHNSFYSNNSGIESRNVA